MPIRLRLDHLLLERGLTLTELAERVGITLANLSILKTNKARAIRLSTLDALCHELECQPGELLEWTSERTRDANVPPGKTANSGAFSRRRSSSTGTRE